MTMIHMYIILSCREHRQEAEDGMGHGIGWLGGRWDVTLYFLSIAKFSCIHLSLKLEIFEIFQEVKVYL